MSPVGLESQCCCLRSDDQPLLELMPVKLNTSVSVSLIEDVHQNPVSRNHQILIHRNLGRDRRHPEQQFEARGSRLKHHRHSDRFPGKDIVVLSWRDHVQGCCDQKNVSIGLLLRNDNSITKGEFGRNLQRLSRPTK